MDWIPFVIDKALAPALTALGGFVGAAHRFQTRLKALEGEFETLKIRVLEEAETQYGAWRVELDQARDGLDVRIRDLEKKLEQLEADFHRFQRESSHDFAKDAELVRFIEEQQRQWQQMQRTLGQIEGILRTTG